MQYTAEETISYSNYRLSFRVQKMGALRCVIVEEIDYFIESNAY